MAGNHNPQSNSETTNSGASMARITRIEDEAYDIRIARDGTWYHEGSPIRRVQLARLFASVLRRDETGDFWLITPAERGRIRVDDAPFVAVAMEVAGEGENQILTFRTNLDEEIRAGAEHPIRMAFDTATGEPSPYLHVRGEIGNGLEALIARAVYYDLVELGIERAGPAGTEIGVWSEGCFFILGSRE